MISYLYRTTKSTTFKQLDAYKPGSWINVVDPDRDELGALAAAHNLDLGILLDVLDEDEMPRLERDDGANYLFTRFAHDSEGTYDNTEVLLMVIKDELFVTISAKPLPVMEKIKSGKKVLITTQRTKLFLELLNSVVDGYDSQLNVVGRQVKGIRNKLKQQEVRNADFINFVSVEDELNEFLTVLMPTTSILRRLLIGKHVNLYDEDQELVEDLMLNTEQSIEEAKSILRTIVNIREAHSTIMTNNLNRVIRILTVITAVLAIPTLVSSLYGMNVDLPGSGSSDAFALIVLFSFLISLLTLLYFRWKKWL